MITCPLCGQDFDETALSCQGRCPMAQVQGCSLLCCPHCGYQMVDERKSSLAQLIKRVWKPVRLQTPEHPAGQPER